MRSHFPAMSAAIVLLSAMPAVAASEPPGLTAILQNAGDWKITPAASQATTLMTPEAQPTAYAKKAGELAQAAMQDIPARLMAYAEVAKKAQTELLDSVVTLTPKVVEEATAQAKAAAKTAKKAA